MLTFNSVAAVNGTVISSATSTLSPVTGTTTLTSSSTATSSYVVAPSPTTSGTTPYCYQWYTVETDDSCSDVAAEYGITLDEFIALNTNVDSSCDGFWSGYSYCVSGVPLASSTSSIITTTSVPTATTAIAVTTPSPIQAGMASGCTVFYETKANDGCYDIAAEYGITLDDFYAWNPAVGDSCADLYVGYYYCVDM